MIDWRHWHNEPHLIGGLLLLAWAYALLTGPLRPRVAPRAPYPRAHAIRFYGSLLIFYLAVGSPLDQAGERFLLSAHMIQHQLLIYGSAVLFLRGLPPWLVQPVSSRLAPSRAIRVLVHPMVCALVYVLTLSLWHSPGLYDLALQSKTVHVLEHLMFFGAALLYWWPLLSPAPELPPLRPAAQIVYLLAVTVAMTPLFAFLAFSDNILYPTYEFAPRVIARLGPAEDQLLGAMLMKLGGMGVTLVAMGVAFYRWNQLSAESPGGDAVLLHSAP